MDLEGLVFSLFLFSLMPQGKRNSFNGILVSMKIAARVSTLRYVKTKSFPNE